MTAVAAGSSSGSVRGEGGAVRESAAGSEAFKAEVAKADAPKAEVKPAGGLVAPKERPKTVAQAAEPAAKADVPEGDGKAEGSKDKPKGEPSHLATVNSHSSQLGSMRGAIADAEADRGSQTVGMQALNNGLSFVNGERRNWEAANATVGAYEQKLDAYAAGARDAPSADELTAARRDAESAVQAYTGQAIANDAASGEAAASALVRGQGVLKATGGALQTAAGVGMLAAPEPTMLTKVGGSVAVAKGVDDVQAGVRQALSGQETNTATHDASAAAARGLGADEATAQRVGGAVDFAAGVGVPTGLVQRVGANMDEGMRLLPAAAKAGKDAVGDGLNAVRNFGRGLVDGPPPGPVPAAGQATSAPSDSAPPVPDGPAATAAPPPTALDADGLLGRGSLVDHDRYPNLYKTELPNGVTALYDADFQATRLKDPNFFNDLKDVMQAVDDVGHRRPVEVVTRSGKTITGQALPPGNEAKAYRVDDLVAKVKRDDVARYQSPTDKMMSVKDLQNSPEAAKWEHEANLEIGDVLFALSGSDKARRSNDLLIQPFYPAQARLPLVEVDEGGTATRQLQAVLDRTGHGGVRIDDGGGNVAVNEDRNVFFDPVGLRARDPDRRKSAWVETKDPF